MWSPRTQRTRALLTVLAVSLAALTGGLGAASDACARAFSPLAVEMGAARYAPAAAALPNGDVLIAGGESATGTVLTSAEVFNPASGRFEALAHELAVAREEPGYATLRNGDVLLVGGHNESEARIESAELFRPATGTFEKLAADMTAKRDGPAAALLPNGDVLIVGGRGEAGPAIKSAELFDPETQAFEAVAAPMTETRYMPAIATLPDGKVLIVGGENERGVALKSTELFDPESDTFEALSAEAAEARTEAAHATLPNGDVLIAGGWVGGPTPFLNTAELFNVQAGKFEKLSAPMSVERDGPAAAVLPNGSVLVAGGYNNSAPAIASAEELTPDAPTIVASGIAAVGMNEATLTGALTSEGPGSDYFQYGPSTAYGASTAPEGFDISLSPLTTSAAVGGLAPGTTYHMRLVAENAGGVTYGPDTVFTTARALAVAAAVVPKPRLRDVAESHRSWREGNALARISRRRRTVPVGTTFSLALNVPAEVSFRFAIAHPGRRVGGRCVAANGRNRRRARCTRSTIVATLSFAGHSGVNRVAFQGRVSRTKKLPPGRYTLSISTSNSAGASSAPSSLRFTIVR